MKKVEKENLRQNLQKLEYSETRNLACYLISLFYKSGCIYFCSRPKINRLLTIYKLASISFNEDCFKYGFNIDSTYIFVGSYIYMIERDVYYNCNYDENGKLVYLSNDNKDFYNGNFTHNSTIPNWYHMDEYDINSSQKRLLEIIFRKFASYSVGDLGMMIDELHHNIPFERKNDEFGFAFNYLDKEKLKQFLNSESNNELYKNNEVFNFAKIIVNEYIPDNIFDYDNECIANKVLKLVNKEEKVKK